METKKRMDYSTLTKYVKKIKNEYINKYFMIRAKAQLPLPDLENNKISMENFLNALKERVDISGKIENLSVELEDLEGWIDRIPCIKISFNGGKNLLLTEPCFLNDLVIGDSLEEVYTNFELIEEVRDD